MEERKKLAEQDFKDIIECNDTQLSWKHAKEKMKDAFDRFKGNCQKI